MVASFCRTFGGQLQIQSALGVGTSVILTFPWVPDAAPRTQLFPREAEEKKTPSRRALVVVPDPRLRRYAGRLLTTAGHQVTELEDAAGVVEQVMTRPPDVILLDQPVASQRVPSSLARALGPMSRPLELLAWLTLTRPDLPIVVTTHDEPARETHGVVGEIGPRENLPRSVGLLRKPYSEAELARILQLLTRP
jgi:CheY-like chemotaxis protein